MKPPLQHCRYQAKAIAGKEDAGLRRIFVRLQGAKAGA
jgi:hypothetical protein